MGWITSVHRENAMILYEIREEDLQAFLRQLSAEGRYDAVVFSVGSMICGCQLIFHRQSESCRFREEICAVVVLPGKKLLS
ncbi:MAG: hypothetical protein ACLUD0_07190 [Eubacterium ramulus]